jgi:hypothetical protein
VDFRDLNRATPKDEYPMPVAETLINAAAGHKILSFMDGNASYNQIFMAPEDINVFDLVCVFKDLNAKGKGHFCNYEKFRSFCAKCV